MHAVLLTLLLMVGSGALAKCAGPQMWVYPSEKTLAQDQALLIEAYQVDHALFMAHMRNGMAYLTAGETRVPLRFITGQSGQFSLCQAVFIPTAVLEIGRTCTLYLEDLPAALPQPVRWEDLFEAVPCSWTMAASSGHTSMTVARDAIVARSTLVEYGCGPATDVYVELGTAIPQGALCAVRLTREDGNRGNYILPVKDGLVAIGHGMCSGAFGLILGERYTADLTLLRDDGQALPESRRSVSFAGPTEVAVEE